MSVNTCRTNYEFWSHFFCANNVNVIFYRFFLSRFGASILPVFKILERITPKVSEASVENKCFTLYFSCLSTYYRVNCDNINVTAQLALDNIIDHNFAVFASQKAKYLFT